MIRTKISVAGFKDAEIAEGLPYFREYLEERSWLVNPQAEWDTERGLLLVTIDTGGDDPKFESATAFDEVWDCVIAAFNASGTISFDILEAALVESG